MEKSKYVLDTSALFCLKDNEEGSNTVEEILEKAGRKQCDVLISFITLMEYYYICLMRYGDDIARQAYLQVSLLPIKAIESNEALRITAAQLKANYPISLADAWIAATAVNYAAVLIHKDPEYDSIGGALKCLALPYK